MAHPALPLFGVLMDVEVCQCQGKRSFQVNSMVFQTNLYLRRISGCKFSEFYAVCNHISKQTSGGSYFW